MAAIAAIELALRFAIGSRGWICTGSGPATRRVAARLGAIYQLLILRLRPALTRRPLDAVATVPRPHPSPWNVLIWAVEFALPLARACAMETFLGADPEYATCRAKARHCLVPRIF